MTLRALSLALALATAGACETERQAQLQQDYDELHAQVELLEKRVVMLENEAARPSTPRVAATPVGEVERSSLAERYGLLRLNAQPWAEVSVDGRKVGITPIVDHKLEAGKHELQLLNPNCSPHKRTITIDAGKTTSLVIELTCS